jgi:hypothetical protein
MRHRIRQQANSHRFYVYSLIEVLNLSSAKRALAFDLHAAAGQTPQKRDLGAG